MDPVSRILAERERSRPRLFPYAMIALLLHGGLAGTIFLMSRNASARHAQLPAVSVRTRPTRACQTSDTAGPQPAAQPDPRTEERDPRAGADRAGTGGDGGARDRSADPAGERGRHGGARAEGDSATDSAPAPASGGGSGLSIGGGDDQQMPGIPSDFHFAYYVQRMLALIESRWYKPAAPAETRALVRFTINRDGRVSRIELESSSGNSSFDRAALRALYAANPLPPLPPAYSKPSLTVHLTFSE